MQMAGEAVGRQMQQGRHRRVVGRMPPAWSVGVAALAALSLSAGAAYAQEMRPGSAIAGVTWPVSSWDWPDVEGGRRQTIVEAAAGVAGGTCGAEREFNAWNLANEEQPEAFRAAVLSSYADAGWTLTQPAATAPELHVATRGDNAAVLWVRLDAEKSALSLFTCLIRGTPAALATPAGVRQSSDNLNVLRDFGFGALVLALGFFAYGLRQRRRAAAALTWLTVPAVIESSRVEARAVTDADGDETNWYTPRVSYTYNHAGTEFRGERVRLGNSRTTVPKKAEAVVARYPAGAAVEVRINPSKPTEAVLEIEKPSLAGYLPISTMFALAGAGLLVAKQVLAG